MDGVFNYTSLLLSQEDDMLYVGAREALFALSLSDISKTKLQKNVSVAKPIFRVRLDLLYERLKIVFFPRPQLTWATPTEKREECSFKGKNLEVRRFFCIHYLVCQTNESLQQRAVC